MKLPLLNVIVMLLLAGTVSHCGNNTGKESSAVKSHAIPNEENNSVSRVKDGESITYIYTTLNPVSGSKKGYRFECDNVLKLRKLIAATGFPTDLLNSTPILSIDSPAYAELKVNEQPVLSCLPADKTFYKIVLEGKAKYFFTENKLSLTRLYHLGCQSLADSMGFKQETTFPIPTELVESLKVYSASDEDDISCMEGFEIGAKIIWKSGETKSITMKKGERLPLTTYAALKADGSNALITLVQEGRCEWIEQTTVGGALLISGNVPLNFQNQAACTLTISAEAGTLLADSKKLEITAPPLPVEANGWTRDLPSDTGAGGTLGDSGDGICNGTEDCVYKDLSGHLWAKMDDSYRTYDQALSYCFELSYGSYTDWRLPTAEELLQSSVEKIYSLKERGKLNLYDYSWAINTDPLNASMANFVSLIGNGILKSSKSTQLRNICIR